jgi:hypothetical protein
MLRRPVAIGPRQGQGRRHHVTLTFGRTEVSHPHTAARTPALPAHTAVRQYRSPVPIHAWPPRSGLPEAVAAVPEFCDAALAVNPHQVGKPLPRAARWPSRRPARHLPRRQPDRRERQHCHVLDVGYRSEISRRLQR